MKKIVLLSIITLALFSSINQANASFSKQEQKDANVTETYNGTWKGVGVYRRDGITTNCEMEMDFYGENSSFTFVSGNRVCERHSEEFYRVDMHVVDDILVWNGMQVGTFSDELVTVDFLTPGGDGRMRHYRMSMRKEGSVLTYEESRRIVGEAEPVITFAGVLVLQ